LGRRGEAKERWYAHRHDIQLVEFSLSHECGSDFGDSAGVAAEKLGVQIATPVFNGAAEDEIGDLLEAAGLPRSGKTTLYDGRTGKPFHQKVIVGYAYLMKLSKLVDDIGYCPLS